MIHILHYGLSPNRGGIENYLYKIWNNINHEEFHFDFVDEWDGRTCYRKEFEEDGCQFYDVTPRRKSPLKNQKEWMRVIKESKADIIHCHLNTMSYDTPIKCTLKCGKKLIVHSRNSGCKKSFFTRFMHYYHKKRYNKTDFVRLAVSKKAGEWLFGTNVPFTVINNGIDIERFKFAEENRKVIRKEFGIDDNTFVIGNVAAFLPVKNHLFLLDVFNQVLRINSNVVLMLCGDGITKNEVQQKAFELGINDKVIFTGNRPDISVILSAFDIFVMPSLYEGFPNAVLEAETCGLKCVLSEVITGEVDVGNCTYLRFDDGAEKWAKYIASEIDIKRKQIDKREYAYSIIEEKGFSVKNEIQKLEKIYQSLLEGDL